MKTKLLIYDDHCPLCAWYSSLFTKYGWLPKEGRVAFSTLSPELMSAIDLDRGRNEIPLIDTHSGKVLYGIDALLEIFGTNYPFIKKAGNIKPINYFLRKLYKLISYNRKVIVAKKCGPGSIDCTPDMNYFYRVLFMLLFLLFNTSMLYPIHAIILNRLPGINISVQHLLIAHFVIAGINCSLALTFPKRQMIEYLGQANMLALITIILTLPLIVFIKLLSIPEWLMIIYLSLVMVIIFREYIRRMEYANILPANKWIAGINMACMSGFILFVFR